MSVIITDYNLAQDVGRRFTVPYVVYRVWLSDQRTGLMFDEARPDVVRVWSEQLAIIEARDAQSARNKFRRAVQRSKARCWSSVITFVPLTHRRAAPRGVRQSVLDRYLDQFMLAAELGRPLALDELRALPWNLFEYREDR